MVKLKLKRDHAYRTKYLSSGVLFLATINIIIQLAIYSFGLKKEWFLLFNMDKEMNIPTLYSSLMIVLCAFFIHIIAIKEREIRSNSLRRWLVLKWIFIFLAFDEALQIHEALIISQLKPLVPPILEVIWVIPYGLFVIFSLIYFMPLIIKLPSKVRSLILCSGFIYVSGAAGIEVIGNFLVRSSAIKLHGISYGLITTFEESMEMCGLIVFIHALLIYILYYQKQKIKLNLQLASEHSNQRTH